MIVEKAPLLQETPTDDGDTTLRNHPHMLQSRGRGESPYRLVLVTALSSC